MPKVTVVQVVYNNRQFIEPVFSAIFNQTFKDFNVVAVIAGDEDSGKELLKDKFPQVEIIDPGYNIGFAKGHNMVFEKYNSEFFQLVNPDLVMEPDYIEEMLKASNDPEVGAATGKLYKISEAGIKNYEVWKEQESQKILDTTGVIINKSGRAYDRGQHEVDNGQYDNQKIVQAVSAAGAMYRNSALHSVKCQRSNVKGSFEFFDEDFHSYWEDVDLAWRMANKGWKCAFVPSAVAYHGRGAGSSKGGYKKAWSFIKFHRAMSPRIRQLNYKNHILMYLKNSRYLYPQFFIRELFMLIYILIFEPLTLKIFLDLLKTLPVAWNKRKLINELKDAR